MKWGILATGTIAKKFASTVEQMGAEGERLVAVGSRHLESAQAFAQQYGIPRCYDSYEALAADPEVEAIYIATPNTLHYENCKLCLEQGKHVLCEKPFTISPEQAQQLYRLAEEKHLFLMEAFWIWLLPLYDRLRQILAAGTIGELKQITCQYGFVASGARKDRKFDSGLGGGALLDIGIYNLGFLRILTGQDPEKVETKEVHINEYGTDDYSRLALTYPGGCMAESVQTIGQELERNARIVGTKGSIFLPDFQHAETMTLEVEGKEPEVIRCPVDINGFEYEIQETSRCVKLGRTGSDRYTPQDSTLPGLMLSLSLTDGSGVPVDAAFSLSATSGLFLKWDAVAGTYASVGAGTQSDGETIYWSDQTPAQNASSPVITVEVQDGQTHQPIGQAALTLAVDGTGYALADGALTGK